MTGRISKSKNFRETPPKIDYHALQRQAGDSSVLHRPIWMGRNKDISSTEVLRLNFAISQQHLGNAIVQKQVLPRVGSRKSKFVNCGIIGIVQREELTRQQEKNVVLATHISPPPKNSRPTPERITALTEWLIAHIAGHPLATDAYTFYEEIDRYLGPWGAEGYPLAYGKRYNILFSTNGTLMADPMGKEWVWKTTIFLQQALLNYIVSRYKAGSLEKLTETELRAAAFISHPNAYTKAGLDMVVLVAPELIPEIISIPGAEFDPGSENFASSIKQVVATVSMTIPRMISNLVASAIPAHTGSFRLASSRDQHNFVAQIQLQNYLFRVKRAIVAGQLNNIQLLHNITKQLVGQEFPNQEMAGIAREVIQLADQRKRELAQRYAEAVKKNPKLKVLFDAAQPGWE